MSNILIDNFIYHPYNPYSFIDMMICQLMEFTKTTFQYYFQEHITGIIVLKKNINGIIIIFRNILLFLIFKNFLLTLILWLAYFFSKIRKW